MTAFEGLERGVIDWASDPLSEKGRPMLVLGARNFRTTGLSSYSGTLNANGGYTSAEESARARVYAESLRL